MARAKQPVSVGGISFDALIESEEGYEAEVPEYPTENGFSISDTIVLKPDTLSMTLFVTDTPVTWKDRLGAGIGKTEAVVKQLKELYFKKQPVEVITSDTVYANMAITSLSIKKSVEVGYAREIPISFKKIVVTESKTVTIPASYGKSGKTKASAGTANQKSAAKTSAKSSAASAGNSSGAASSGSSSQKKSSGKSSSILYQAASSFGLFK